MYYGEINLDAAFTGGTLLIGYGNSLRGDDGAGPAVVERLQRLLGSQVAGVLDCLIEAQPLPEMADPISRARRVIFVDASVCLPPGRVQVHRLRAQNVEYSLGHHLSPEQLLALCRDTFGSCPAQVWMVAIGAQSMSIGDTLSPVVSGAIERLCRHLQYHLRSWSQRDHRPTTAGASLQVAGKAVDAAQTTEVI